MIPTLLADRGWPLNINLCHLSPAPQTLSFEPWSLSYLSVWGAPGWCPPAGECRPRRPATA